MRVCARQRPSGLRSTSPSGKGAPILRAGGWVILKCRRHENRPLCSCLSYANTFSELLCTASALLFGQIGDPKLCMTVCARQRPAGLNSTSPSGKGAHVSKPPQSQSHQRNEAASLSTGPNYACHLVSTEHSSSALLKSPRHDLNF